VLLTAEAEPEGIDRSVAAVQALDAAVWALCTFKEGSVVRTAVRKTPQSPLAIGTVTHGVLQRLPSSNYSIATTEIASLEAHALRCAALQLWPAVETALDRLIDANARQHAKDAMLDAVTGLEILLGQGRDDREGLRYRFAIQYAALAPYEDKVARRRRFRAASALYGVRSKATHEGTADQQYAFDGDMLDIQGVATRAKCMLRETILRFLQCKDVPHSKREQEKYWTAFWEDQVFGDTLSEAGACQPP
jgi:hypothetical protein